MSEANKKQFGGTHYKGHPLNHWDIVALFEEELGYFLGNSTKYMFRWKKKGGIQDLEKALHYLQKKIEIERSRAEGTLVENILQDAVDELLDQKTVTK